MISILFMIFATFFNRCGIYFTKKGASPWISLICVIAYMICVAVACIIANNEEKKIKKLKSETKELNERIKDNEKDN